jgi:hypothetical protein
MMAVRKSCQEIELNIAFVFDYEGESVTYLKRIFTRWGEDGEDFSETLAKCQKQLDEFH